MFKKFNVWMAVALASMLGMFSVPALADSAAATAAITSAQTDALAVAGGLVAMGVAIWGALYLYKKFFK